MDCLARFQRELNPELLRRPWTHEEGRRLADAVAKHGRHWAVRGLRPACRGIRVLRYIGHRVLEGAPPGRCDGQARAPLGGVRPAGCPQGYMHQVAASLGTTDVICG